MKRHRTNLNISSDTIRRLLETADLRRANGGSAGEPRPNTLGLDHTCASCKCGPSVVDPCDTNG